MSTKRIAKEYAETSQSPPKGISVSLPPNCSLHTWHVVLAPPPESPYHPGRYGLLLHLPPEYPFKPPSLRFTTRIYHPNVTNDAQGNVCLALLKPENWKPSTRLAAVLDAVSALLLEPQPDDPLEERIADEYRRDRPAWEKVVSGMVARFAMGEPEFKDGTAAAAAAAGRVHDA
ncbi:hypothetical protein E4U53_007391 [Claviceps sorghi]|nr:hypothetical protein E4U53_007391 [Claviceps sorghi]